MQTIHGCILDSELVKPRRPQVTTWPVKFFALYARFYVD